LLGLSLGKADTAAASFTDNSDTASWKDLPPHPDEGQVQLDVNRAFVYYPDRTCDHPVSLAGIFLSCPPCPARCVNAHPQYFHAIDSSLGPNNANPVLFQDNNEEELARKKDELSALIVETLRCYPYLCYFQGYHDICQVLLLVLPPATRVSAVVRLSALRIRDFMLPSLHPAIDQLRLIPDILRAADPPLWRHLSQTEPFFALSGTLTMYAHDITTLGEIARLFDALLAHEPVFTVYLFAAIVRGRRAELFDTPPDEPEMLHSILSKLPVPLHLDDLIAAAVALFRAHPPEQLPTWRRISSASVLKTARDPAERAKQTMADGEMFFQRQVKDLQWMERQKQIRKVLWRYRRPARTLGLAILVGVVAIWLRRSPGPMSFVAGIFARWIT
jgi:hypothetical protein